MVAAVVSAMSTLMTCVFTVRCPPASSTVPVGGGVTSLMIDTLNPDDRLLIIDDVFDSGRSIRAFIAELKARCRHNMPRDIRIATVWFKPGRNVTDLRPDFFVRETDQWLIFPHEIDGLTVEEIRRHKPEAAIILRQEEVPGA